PELDTNPDEEVVAFVKSLAERNDHGKVAFGTEGGLFQSRAEIPTVVCGPGSSEQAHKPDEVITLEQVATGEAFLRRLMDRVCVSAAGCGRRGGRPGPPQLPTAAIPVRVSRRRSSMTPTAPHILQEASRR